MKNIIVKIEFNFSNNLFNIKNKNLYFEYNSIKKLRKYIKKLKNR